jgi:hypothetical protein
MSASLRRDGIDSTFLGRIFADQPETVYSDACCHFNDKGLDAIVNAIALGSGTDPLATPAVLFILVGLCATLIGLVVTGVSLALPERAKATVTASCTNGGISVGSLDNFEVSEKSRRHLEGKLNGGGTAVELHTTNGGVRLRSKAPEGESTTDGAEPPTVPKTLKSQR